MTMKETYKIGATVKHEGIEGRVSRTSLLVGKFWHVYVRDFMGREYKLTIPNKD